MLNFLLFFCLFSITLCDEVLTTESVMNLIENDVSQKSFSDSILSFSLDFVQAINDEKYPNIIFSPLGIELTFSMLLHGSKGETRKQLLHALRLGDIEENVIHNEFFKLLNHYKINLSKKQPRDFQLAVANLVLINQNFSIELDYKNHLLSKFLASVANEDFSKGEELKTHINNWVRNKTNNNVKHFLTQPLSPENLMVLINTVYFKGKWNEPFKSFNTRDKRFWKNNDDSYFTTLMYKHNTQVNYFENDTMGIKAVSLPYNGNVSMFIILPNSKAGVRPLKHSLTKEMINFIINNMEMTDLVLALPKFKVEAEWNLHEIFPSLGLAYAFTRLANFSISEQKNLYISRSVQRTQVKVDEEGTEAVAATSAEVATFSANLVPSKSFIVDHPFLFFIRDDLTKMFLFFGEIKQPRP